MKYIIVLGDGMADLPIPELDGRTPLEASFHPYADMMAKNGTVGMVRTIPEGMPPGSDAANMSVMGFAPRKYYTGRSPLEAVSLGVKLAEDDVAIRCNLVTLTGAEELEDNLMGDYSSGEIETEESRQLIEALKEELDSEGCTLYSGISYRHCLVLHHTKTGTQLTPPHDISGKSVKGMLPKGLNGAFLEQYMRRSAKILSEHPVNLKRKAAGKPTADCCWFWGEGTKPSFDTFENIYEKKAGMVCAVDLLKGLGKCAGMKVPFVPGATGAKRTDFAAKGKAALKLLDEGCDLVYIHVEAPDESGHAGDLPCKIEAIENIDKNITGFLIEALKARREDFRILFTPDHPTPVSIRTHTPDPVPFVLYDSRCLCSPSAERYTEKDAKQTGLFLSEGPMLMKLLLEEK